VSGRLATVYLTIRESSEVDGRPPPPSSPLQANKNVPTKITKIDKTKLEFFMSSPITAKFPNEYAATCEIMEVTN
jgi:hypothetical protein